MLLSLLIFLIAFVSTLLLTPVVRPLALKIGAVDSPNDRKIHKEPIPRLGGLAIYFGFLVAIVAGLLIFRFMIMFFIVTVINIYLYNITK